MARNAIKTPNSVWDQPDNDGDGRADQGWHGRGNHHGEPSPVTVDQLNLTTFHHSDTAANGTFHDQFILVVNAAASNGTAVTVTGLDTSYGLYLTVENTGHPTLDANGKPINGGNVFDTLDVKLMLDPGHNDGAASSTLTGGIGFANGTEDDVELAHGSIVSGHFVAGPDAAGHADFVEALTVSRAGMAFLGGSVVSGDTLEEILTSPFALRHTVRNSDGTSVSVLENGTSTASLVPNQPFTLPGTDEDGSIPALMRTEFIAAHSGTRADFEPSGAGRELDQGGGRASS